MNLERLFSKIINNQHLLRDKKKTIIFLKYHFHLLATKRRKLKLGKVVFEIKEYRLDEMPAYKEEVEIRYIRQDTLDDDELKLENRLKALAWKWDFSHVAAFLIVNFVAVSIIYIYIYWWYCDTFPTFAFKPKKFKNIVRYGIPSIIVATNPGTFRIRYRIVHYEEMIFFSAIGEMAAELDIFF